MTISFEKLKEMVAEAVALQIPDTDRKFTLVTDGSDRGVGAMLAHDRNPRTWKEVQETIWCQ